MLAKPVAQTVLFFCLLTAASVWDLKKRMIPDTICLLILLAGLLNFGPASLFGIFAALPLFLAAMWKPGSVGGGDIKLTAAAGFVTGLFTGMTGLVFGLMANIIYYLIHQMVRKMRGLALQAAADTALPMAPFLSLGFLTAYLLKIGGYVI